MAWGLVSKSTILRITQEYRCTKDELFNDKFITYALRSISDAPIALIEVQREDRFVENEEKRGGRRRRSTIQRLGEKGLSGIAEDRKATISSGTGIGTEGSRATGQESITHDGI